ncbi:MAG: AP2/ERF family transcription factor [Desulfurivibrionaceae bacterium]|nr:AP2/ERF family transcription factor [Desulfobulbales bacterium]MDT8335341.1 AP2/ERF family transcription factor [Desulfurivibrionaceae bacterium]
MATTRETASKHKDIARIDQESKRSHGWYVRVRYFGKNHSKFFSDKKNGGRNSALLAAIAWRDSTRKKIGKPQTDKHIVTKSTSNTGVVGVRHDEKLNCFFVSWVDREGKPGKTSVSINRHGRLGAFKKACEVRERKEAERLDIA